MKKVTVCIWAKFHFNKRWTNHRCRANDFTQSYWCILHVTNLTIDVTPNGSKIFPGQTHIEICLLIHFFFYRHPRRISQIPGHHLRTGLSSPTSKQTSYEIHGKVNHVISILQQQTNQLIIESFHQLQVANRQRFAENIYFSHSYTHNKVDIQSWKQIFTSFFYRSKAWTKRAVLGSWQPVSNDAWITQTCRVWYNHIEMDEERITCSLERLHL